MSVRRHVTKIGTNGATHGHHAPFHRTRTRLTSAAAAVNERFVKRRTCLGCDRPFRSNGPWNRFCPQCTERNSPDAYRTYHVSDELGTLRDYHSRLIR